MELRRSIIETLKNEVVPATGCTEPVAVALAAAKAMEPILNKKKSIMEIHVSANVFKNGMGVGIPNCDYIGLEMAAALGYALADGTKGLNLLEMITNQHVSDALEAISSGKIKVLLAKTDEKIYIEAKVLADTEHSEVIISGKHNHFSKIAYNESIYVSSNIAETVAPDSAELVYTSTIKDLVEAIEKISFEELAFLMEGMEMNLSVAEFGLKNRLGMAVGATLNDKVESGFLSRDLMNWAMILTAAASDARMAGVGMPVMSSNGSGNNGLTAVLPLAAYNQFFTVEPEKMVKALAISHSINCYIKKRIGRLSSLCGCSIAAATGAAAALSWLMNGTISCIEGTIQKMIADVSGTICDGAKTGCALKLSTSAAVAVKYALLGNSNCVVPAHNGIIGNTVEETIENLGRLSNEGMKITDSVILNIMSEMCFPKTLV